MFNLNVKTADRMLDFLHGGGPEQRARKAVAAYRKTQSPETHAAALAKLALVDKNRQFETRSQARA
ncbi:hypothetical protein N9F34_03865 [Alphaproteobacteria bacterium]|nr:hypothetical protein [Alphaproteobacteria bacterium]